MRLEDIQKLLDITDADIEYPELGYKSVIRLKAEKFRSLSTGKTL
jgi:hypothetical protein